MQACLVTIKALEALRRINLAKLVPFLLKQDPSVRRNFWRRENAPRVYDAFGALDFLHVPVKLLHSLKIRGVALTFNNSENIIPIKSEKINKSELSMLLPAQRGKAGLNKVRAAKQHVRHVLLCSVDKNFLCILHLMRIEEIDLLHDDVHVFLLREIPAFERQLALMQADAMARIWLHVINGIIAHGLMNQ